MLNNTLGLESSEDYQILHPKKTKNSGFTNGVSC